MNTNEIKGTQILRDLIAKLTQRIDQDEHQALDGDYYIEYVEADVVHLRRIE